jgi:trans-aconitate methyltransferase
MPAPRRTTGVGGCRIRPGVVPALREALELDGAGRLLDIGCGPGSFTLLVAPLFDQAVGIDADADMIAVAAEAG